MSIVQKEQVWCGNLATADDVVSKIRDFRPERVDLRFADMFGRWRKCIAPVSTLDLKSLEKLGGFPGAEIPWCKDVHDGDALVVPDPASGFLDPFAETPTLVLICNVRDLGTDDWSPFDSRSFARKAEGYLQKTHIGGSPRFRLEFKRRPMRHPESEAPGWFAETQDVAGSSDLRRQAAPAILAKLRKAGVEFDDRGEANREHDQFSMRAAPLTRAADNFMIYFYVAGSLLKEEARITSDSALQSGWRMYVDQSIWRGDHALFYGDGYAGTSAIMRHYMAGLAEHTEALVDILELTSRSPWNSAFGRGTGMQRDASLDHSLALTPHISISSRDAKSMSARFFCPSASCNPYLAFAAMLLAGIDGFQYRMYNVDPNEPIAMFFDRPRRDLAEDESSMAGLGADNEFLLRDELLAPNVIASLVGGRSPPGKQPDSQA